MLVLDTHALIWAHKGIRISKRVERRIVAAGEKHELGAPLVTADGAIVDYAAATRAVRVIEI
jgi:hypothetical protein